MNSLPLGRVMLVVAHPDDESGAASLILQRAQDSMVVFCTDGAPADPWFWSQYGTRKAYAGVRRSEAVEALATIGAKCVSFLTSSNPDEFHDQALHKALPSAIDLVARLARWYEPEVIVTSAYEGGHPDHDSCSFIAFSVGASSQIPVWEIPLYHRSPSGELVYQSFADPNGSEIRLVPKQSETAAKSGMLRQYRSQRDLQLFASAPVEYVRPQKAYDYSQPPSHVINYEVWRWHIRAVDLCTAFSQVPQTLELSSRPTVFNAATTVVATIP